MTVVGQPKTAAEYIQATSRVGRDSGRPGLVVTLLNMHKPRDRSHYERFRHFHETFYRAVEVASVTPFAARALDRGFAGALVALARQAFASMTPSTGATAIKESRTRIERLLQNVFSQRIRNHATEMVGDAELDEQLQSVRNRIDDLLDAWCAIQSETGGVGQRLRYQKYEPGGYGVELLREMMDETIEDEVRRKFRANRSLRDVEPEVKLVLVDS